MSGKGFSSSAGRHDSRSSASPPPFAPAAQRTPPPDDVTRTSAGRKRTRSPGREVALPLPLMGSTLETTEMTGVLDDRDKDEMTFFYRPLASVRA